jgi:hypothetical protein
MNVLNTITATGLLIIAVVFAYTLYAFTSPDMQVRAEPAVATDASADSEDSSWWWFRRRERGPERWCRNRADHWVEEAAEHVNEHLTLNAQQKTSFSAVTASIQTASQAVSEACVTNATGWDEKTAPARFEAIENLSFALVNGFKDVRVSFDGFYDDLSADQKVEMDKLLSRRGHHHWH